MPGSWLDTQTGKVVEKEPQEGVQLVSPNVEAGPEHQEWVDAAKVAAGQKKADEVPDDQSHTEEAQAAGEKAHADAQAKSAWRAADDEIDPNAEKKTTRSTKAK